MCGYFYFPFISIALFFVFFGVHLLLYMLDIQFEIENIVFFSIEYLNISF